MLISATMNEQMNLQVGHEFGASLQYVNIEAYFDHVTKQINPLLERASAEKEVRLSHGNNPDRNSRN